MAPHPGSDHGRELPGLKIETSIFPGRDPHRVFIQPDLSAVIGRIETAVDSRLGESINRGTKLRVDEQAESRIKKRVARRQDEARRGSTEGVPFEVERAADPRPDRVTETGK